MLKYKVQPMKNPKTGATLFYARLVSPVQVKLSQLTDVISKQSTITVHDVKAVLSALEEHIITYLYNGNSIRLGDLGSFRASIKSEGVDSKEDFTSANIKRVKVVFTPSTNMKYLLDKSNPNVQFVKETSPEDEAEG